MQTNKNHLYGLINFDHNDKIYNDHFPGNPIVPGSIIVNSFITILKKHKLINGNYVISNFKFISFIKPGEYDFSIEYNDNIYKCKLKKNKNIMVKGAIKI